MTSLQFRRHYIGSLLGTTVGICMIAAGIILFIWSSFTDVSTLPQGEVLWALIKTGLKTGFWTLAGLGVSVASIIWNVLIAFLRSHTQNNGLKLFTVVLISWVVQFVFPLLGIFVSFVLQIWAWFLGSKDI